MNNKRYIIITTAIIMLLIVVLFIVFRKPNDIVGTWVINKYYINDQHISHEDIGEYMGVNFKNAHELFYITFDDNNDATIQLPQYEGQNQETRNCNYKISGNKITLSIDGNNIAILKLNGDKLVLDKETLSFEVELIRK